MVKASGVLPSVGDVTGGRGSENAQVSLPGACVPACAQAPVSPVMRRHVEAASMPAPSLMVALTDRGTEPSA